MSDRSYKVVLWRLGFQVLKCSLVTNHPRSPLGNLVFRRLGFAIAFNQFRFSAFLARRSQVSRQQHRWRKHSFCVFLARRTQHGFVQLCQRSPFLESTAVVAFIVVKWHISRLFGTVGARHSHKLRNGFSSNLQGECLALFFNRHSHELRNGFSFNSQGECLALFFNRHSHELGNGFSSNLQGECLALFFNRHSHKLGNGFSSNLQGERLALFFNRHSRESRNGFSASL